jgi:signal transduction histidine kinase
LHAVTLAAVALGSALLVGVPLYVQAAALLESSLHDRLEGIAELAAVGLTGDNGRGEAADVILATIREEADLDAICLLEQSGKPLRFSAVDRAACELEPEDLWMLAGLSELDAAYTRVRRGADGAPYLFALAPLVENADGASVVAVRASAPYLARLDDLRALFALAGVAGVLLVGLLGAWSAKHLVRPIERLASATRRLGEGGVPEPQEPASTLELEALQEAFTGMSVLIRAREQSLRALGGAVAHEVRNPAHALRLHLGLLRRELADKPGVQLSRLDTLQALLDELDDTVGAFLSFAQDRPPRRQRVNLRALLESAAEGADVMASEVEVSVDPVLVKRAVANLVRNAIQMGSAHVVVRATCAEGDQSCDERHVLVIEVEDSGPGFPVTLLATAFEPFVAGRSDGTGLGMAIVAAVARAHGGSARISRPGPNGTVVELRLPLG